MDMVFRVFERRFVIRFLIADSVYEISGICRQLQRLTNRPVVVKDISFPIIASDTTERWCDRVAGAALVPVDELRNYVGRRSLMDGREDRMVDLVSREFKVSVRAAAVALEQCLSIPGLYRRTDGRLAYRDRNPRSSGGGGPGWGRIELRFRKFGRGLIKTVFEHFARGHVTESQVRRFLQLGGDEIYDAAHRIGSTYRYESFVNLCPNLTSSAASRTNYTT